MAKHKKHNPWPSRVAAVGAIVLTTQMLAAPAIADRVDMSPGGLLIEPGHSDDFTVQLKEENNANQDVVSGCNALSSAKVTITFSAEDGWATVSPTSVEFSDCDTPETVSVSVAALTSEAAHTKIHAVATGGRQDVPVQVLIGRVQGVEQYETRYLDSQYDNNDVVNVTVAPLDTDDDGVLDSVDNCYAVANPGQTDTDSDGVGDACDTDSDNDGVLDANDDCPLVDPVVDVDGDGCEDTAAVDAAAPTSAAIIINDGEAWTNATGVTVDLDAADNVGVVAYALATTQTGLDSATPAAVTPATSFSADDVGASLAAADAIDSAVWVRYFDAAGNATDASDTIGLDTVAPVITGSTGSYTLGTWTNQDVVVDFSCAEAGTVQSGIFSDTVAGETLSSTGADQTSTSTGGCIDAAGNSATAATVTDIDIDKVAPVAGFSSTSPVHGGTYWSTTVPTAVASCSDLLSGVATTNGCVLGGSVSGTQHTITATATDNAGNTASASRTFTVNTLTSTGFYQPVDMGDSALNTVRAGSTVPFKFNIKVNGTNVTNTGLVKSFTYRSVPCTALTGALEDTIEQVTTGGTTLRYDTSGNQFIQNWQTPKAVGCYRAGVTLDDNSQIVANFKLK